MSSRDALIRQAAFKRLNELEAIFGDAIPASVLNQGFQFEGQKVTFKSGSGPFKPKVITENAALSITTTPKSPYQDQELEEEWLYAYQAGSIDRYANRWLRGAMESRVPIIFFIWASDSPRTYEAIWPCWIVEDMPQQRLVRVQAGRHFVPDLSAATLPEPDEEIERRYTTREVKVRLHQRRFRKAVLKAYNEHCVICRLREPELLDASHIVGDADAKGVPAVSNGMALCAIHHRAFDNMLITLDPDYRVRVSERLLEDEDGPMLEHGIKDFHMREAMYLPRRHQDKPNREALEERLGRFR